MAQMRGHQIYVSSRTPMYAASWRVVEHRAVFATDIEASQRKPHDRPYRGWFLLPEGDSMSMLIK